MIKTSNLEQMFFQGSTPIQFNTIPAKNLLKRDQILRDFCLKCRRLRAALNLDYSRLAPSAGRILSEDNALSSSRSFAARREESANLQQPKNKISD